MTKSRDDESERMLATIGLGIFLSLDFQSKNKNIAIYRTVILSGMIYRCETWPVILNKEYRLKVFADSVLRMIFRSNREETMEGRKEGKKCIVNNFVICYPR